MELLIKIIQFFLCFTILVGIHEFGHFIMARIFRIRVDKFYIFFDPWFSLFKFRRGETEYGLGWLPLGGYVKIAGMIDESMDKSYQQHEPKPWEFRAKPAWKRFLVMIAGVVMNLLLANAIYIGICYTWGETYFANEDAKWGYNFNDQAKELGFRDGDLPLAVDGVPVTEIDKMINSMIITESGRQITLLRAGKEVTIDLPFDKLVGFRQQKGYENMVALRTPFLIDSVVNPAAAALRHGDEIVAIDDLTGADFPAYRKYLGSRAGDSVRIELVRGDERLAMVLPVSDEGTLGVVAASPFTLRVRNYTLAQAIPAGFRKAGEVLASYWEQLKLIVQPKTKMYEELGGFISIGSIFPSEWNWQDFWMKTAFLSIILAVMNILPIPGLDGGHAIFTFWEMVSGRKVSDKVLEVAQYIGLGIILLLLVYANGNDIFRFFLK